MEARQVLSAGPFLPLAPGAEPKKTYLNLRVRIPGAAITQIVMQILYPLLVPPVLFLVQQPLSLSWRPDTSTKGATHMNLSKDFVRKFAGQHPRLPSSSNFTLSPAKTSDWPLC